MAELEDGPGAGAKNRQPGSGGAVGRAAAAADAPLPRAAAGPEAEAAARPSPASAAPASSSTAAPVPTGAAPRLSPFQNLTCAAAACIPDAAPGSPPPPLPLPAAPLRPAPPPSTSPDAGGSSPGAALGGTLLEISEMPSLEKPHEHEDISCPIPTQKAVHLEFPGTSCRGGEATPVLFRSSPAQPFGRHFPQLQTSAAAAATAAAAAVAAAAAAAAASEPQPPRAAAGPTAAPAAGSTGAPVPCLAPLKPQGSLEGHWAAGGGAWTAAETRSGSGGGGGGAQAAGRNRMSTSPFAAPTAASAAVASLAAAGSPAASPRLLSFPAAGAGAPAPPLPAAAPKPSTPSPPLVPVAAPADRFWSIRWQELQSELVALIGSGSFGQVWHAMFHHDEVAVKVISIDRDQDFDNEAMERFKQEVDIQRRLSHTNIVQFRGACCEYAEAEAEAEAGAGAGAGSPNDSLLAYGSTGSGNGSGTFLGQYTSKPQPMLAIVMEYCRLGNLFKMIGKARNFEQAIRQGNLPDSRVTRTSISFQFYTSWERRLEVAYGTAAGLEFMHHSGIVHRDLTSYNVLLDLGRIPGTWVAKLCDFNLSRIIPAEQQLAKSQGLANSPAWQSPELLDGRHYGFPTDVFAFGVILWEIVTLCVPWERSDSERGSAEGPDRSGTQMVRMIAVMEQVISGNRLQFPAPHEVQPALPEAAQLMQLAGRCWDHDPASRPRMNEVANSLKAMLDAVKSRNKELRKAAQQRG